MATSSFLILSWTLSDLKINFCFLLWKSCLFSCTSSKHPPWTPAWRWRAILCFTSLQCVLPSIYFFASLTQQASPSVIGLKSILEWWFLSHKQQHYWLPALLKLLLSSLHHLALLLLKLNHSHSVELTLLSNLFFKALNSVWGHLFAHSKLTLFVLLLVIHLLVHFHELSELTLSFQLLLQLLVLFSDYTFDLAKINDWFCVSYKVNDYLLQLVLLWACVAA